MAYKQGALVHIAGTFTDSTSTLIDPSTVKITVVRPDGDRQTYAYPDDTQLVRSSTGLYYIEVTASVPGSWVYWWHSEGTGRAAEEKTFLVDAAVGADAPDPPRSLGTDFAELQRAVGRYLGTGRYPGTWEPNTRLDVRDIIRSGYRRFLWHPPLTTSSLQGKDGQVQKLKQEEARVWSFLIKTTTLSLAASTTIYDLPDDFGEMIEGGFIFTSDQQSVAIIEYEQVLQMQSQAARTGPPKYAAIRVIDGGQTKYQVVFYPTPETTYTVTYRYTVAPLDLSEQQPIPLGGPLHAETLLEACLAAAEKILNDTEEIHEKKFLECLARSIKADQNLSRLDQDQPWPLEDPSKGLQISKAYLKRRIGLQMQFGPHQAIWTHMQSNLVNMVLETGLRKMYAPMILPNEKYSYEWSFLKPVGKIVTNSDVYVYDLPDDFVDLYGPLTFEPDEGLLTQFVEIIPEYRIRQMLSRSSSAGRPCYAAKRMKPVNPAGGTQYELVFYPPPDDEYPLSFRYQSNPAGLDEEACLPYGGQQHAQTLIEACLTAAEEQGGLVNGPHAAKFLECLMASVSLDRRANCAETMGINHDRSDRVNDYAWLPTYAASSATTYLDTEWE